MGLLTNLTRRQRFLLVLALATCFIGAIVYYYADKSAKAKAAKAKAKAADAQAKADAAQATADAAQATAQATADAQVAADAARATADAVTGPCIPSNSCKEVGSRQPDGNCPSETNKEDSTLCGLAGSLCRGGQCVADCDGSWSDWSACSVSCGVGGIKTRSYNVTTSPSSGGTPCPESPVSQGCNAQACLIQCTSPSVKTGYNVTSETLDDPSNFSVTVDCDTDYHGTPSSTCGAGGGPYVLSGCNANPTCQGYDCMGSANTINPNPDSIICAGSTCQDTECCTVAPPVSCTLPEPAPTGYVYGANKAVTDTGPDTTDITCDATNGWHSDASIVASCDATTSFYSLSGCTQGCAKPVAEVLGYNLTAAPAFLAYGRSSVGIGGSCSVSGTGPVLGSCGDDGNPDNIDYYTVTGCEDVVVEEPDEVNVQEWYIGEKGQDCTAACSAQGKTCSPEDWGSSIHSLTQLQEKIQLAIGGTDPDPDTICPRYASGIPMLNSRTGHPWPGINTPTADHRRDTCYWDSGGSTIVSCLDSNSGDKRLCKCDSCVDDETFVMDAPPPDGDGGDRCSTLREYINSHAEAIRPVLRDRMCPTFTFRPGNNHYYGRSTTDPAAPLIPTAVACPVTCGTCPPGGG